MATLAGLLTQQLLQNGPRFSGGATSTALNGQLGLLRVWEGGPL